MLRARTLFNVFPNALDIRINSILVRFQITLNFVTNVVILSRYTLECADAANVAHCAMNKLYSRIGGVEGNLRVDSLSGGVLIRGVFSGGVMSCAFIGFGIIGE